MEWAAVNAAARGTPDDDGRGSSPEVMTFGDEIRELIKTAGDEIDELHFGDGAQAEIAHPTGRADDGAFTDGSIDDAFPAEFLEKTFAGFKSSAVDADVFANENHGGVGGHFFKHGLANGFEEG